MSTSEGLATEIAAALTRVAFEVHQVNRVEIRCDPSNSPSAAVAKKLALLRGDPSPAPSGQRRAA